MFLNVFNGSPLIFWNWSNWLCHLQSADYEVWGSFGKDHQTTQTTQISRRTLASLSWATLVIWKFCWYCYGNSQNCCCLPAAEGPKKLVCFDRRKGVLTAKLWLTGRADLFLLSWGCTGGAVSDLLVKSCHHVVASMWTRVFYSLAADDACFRMIITLGVVLIRSLVRAKCVLGRLRSGSGAALN